MFSKIEKILPTGIFTSILEEPSSGSIAIKYFPEFDKSITSSFSSERIECIAVFLENRLIKISKTGIERLSSSVINLAKYENLDGHANSVKIRLKLKKEN